MIETNPQAPALTPEQAQNCKRVDIGSKVVVPDVLVGSIGQHPAGVESSEVRC
jgi:hypothetical protein